ncbi:MULTISPECIES: porin [unclassified Thioalkalivibrio]|uniref:porin n=1 Tax=unclassified Thioalkalivibrio TaxID=2621013 RepID=UPI00036F3B97|nr:MULTISPECIES: porin [unclassified Thioalkalivibrio]
MQKKILAMAVAGAFAAAPALASADDAVTLYGQVKYEVGAIDGASGTWVFDGQDTGIDLGSGNRDLTHSTAGSRFGVRGSEDLGGGITGIFRIQGNFGGPGGIFAAGNLQTNEETWVGVDGNFGQVRLGRSDTAMKNAMKPFRAFTDTLADRATRPGTVGQAGIVAAADLGVDLADAEFLEFSIDGRPSAVNSWSRADGIHYQSPDFAGFTFGATLEPVGEKTDSYYSVNAIYEMGPMIFSGAYEGQSSTSDGYGALDGRQVSEDTDVWHAGFSFDFGQGDVGIKYHQWDYDADKLEQVLVPANFRVTDNINLRAAVQYNTWDNAETLDGESSWTNVAVGAQYHFSNRTEAFINVWRDGVMGVTNNNAGGVSGTEEEGLDGNLGLSDDGTHIGVGLRHSF